MFKFEKGDQVSFVYGSILSPNPDGVFQAVVNGGKIIARKSSDPSQGRVYNDYKVSGFSGWWPEENLVLVRRGFKNSPSRNEAAGPIKDQPSEPKLDTGDSGASEDSLYTRELYLKALKKTYGKVPFESETVEVGSLLDFTEAVLKATKEAKE